VLAWEKRSPSGYYCGGAGRRTVIAAQKNHPARNKPDRPPVNVAVNGRQKPFFLPQQRSYRPQKRRRRLLPMRLGGAMNLLTRALIDWPEDVARHLRWLAPLFARITVGWVFLWSGWGKLNNLPQVTENFIGWGIPFPHVLTPFVSGVEFCGGLFLLLGLLTRISAGALGIVMIVAIKSAKWGDVDSLETLLGFDEFEYLALFLWLAVAGPGRISVDYWLQRAFGARADTGPSAQARVHGEA
jgi:putative oxidoreductase